LELFDTIIGLLESPLMGLLDGGPLAARPLDDG